MSYDHRAIERKWQERWEQSQIFAADDKSKKEKCYLLVEFPYPSGAGLHVGHPRGWLAIDVLARKKRMEGKNVLFPMGWDAFGLPAENYAIKTGVHPRVTTKENIDTFRQQIKNIGFSIDWTREVDTTDPAYYRWTQWMFNQMFKAGLAYKAKATINWCPKDKTGLANEEVVGGACERCGTPVEKRDKDQWMIAITKYADRLLEDLKTVDYLPKIKKQQEDWIGKSEGAEISFELKFTFKPEANDNRGPNGEKAQIKVFTTRPDTICGVNSLVLAPEHLWVTLATDEKHEVLANKDEVKAYVESIKGRTEIERTNDDKEKTGVELKGVVAVNPITQEEIPLWVADYVLPQYGTGAIMAVPGHDERDYAFAQKYSLPVTFVVAPHVIDASNPPQAGKKTVARRIAQTIIRDPETGKFLCLKWKKQPWTTFVMGGVEEGEDLVEAALREIKEETGYTNLKLVRVLGAPIKSEYYAAHKGENRLAMATAILFDLVGYDKVEINAEEFEKHEPIWLEQKDLNRNVMQCSELDYWVPRLAGPESDVFTGTGVAINSGELDGLSTAEAQEKVVAQLKNMDLGDKKITYRLRDWVFSRQRYWGEPIPLVHCAKDGWVAVPDDQLPVELPQVEKYEPTDNGESPLSAIESFVNTTCPTCDGPAKRETDTMPNWAGSSWYFLRYIDPKNDKEFAAKKLLKHWTPVDLYNGGMEHTTLHLLYSRFWNKFLFDQGLVPTSEPYARRHSHGLIMSEDGTKMSKSKGNVVNPDDVVAEYGADAFRTYILFMGPFEEHVPWSTNGLVGVRRFLDKVERLAEKGGVESPEVTKALHKTIQKVTENIDDFRFNTAVAELMKFVNTAQEAGAISAESLSLFLKILSPFAPHITNELWEKAGGRGCLEEQPWPQAEASLLVDDQLTIAVQVNGKLRASIVVPAGMGEDEVKTLALADANVQKFVTSQPKKVIVVKGKLINFVV